MLLPAAGLKPVQVLPSKCSTFSFQTSDELRWVGSTMNREGEQTSDELSGETRSGVFIVPAHPPKNGSAGINYPYYCDSLEINIILGLTP